MKFYKEYYSIFNLLKLMLVNKNTSGLLKKINPEYEYFRIQKKINPDIAIKISKFPNQLSNTKCLIHKFQAKYKKWEVEINEFDDGFIDLTIIPCLSGFRKTMEFLALKNLYVRSLIQYKLIEKGFTLIHASAVNINGNAYVFAGRPGVFKTSIIMDLLRQNGIQFLGEENVILKQGKIYPFPLNIQSLDYKIKFYETENPPSIVHKFMLGINLIRRKNYKIAISSPVQLNKIFFLEKSYKFVCKKQNIEKIINKLVWNEVEEINLTPTHTLSGISNNHFSEYLQITGKINNFKKNIREIFIDNLNEEVGLYSVKVPENYSSSIVNNLIKV